MDEARLILSDSLDRALDSREAEILSNKLSSDSDYLNQYVLQGFIHSQLIDWMGQERMQDAALMREFERNGAAGHPAPALVGDAIESISHRPSSNFGEPGRRKPNRLRPTWLAAIAAMLLVAVTMSTIGYFAFARPVYVGQLTEATGCRWAASQGNIPMGTLLKNGQTLQLVAGRAVITFASGAQILLEGPVSLRLDSKDAAHLFNGRIATKVPTHAIGFVVTSPLARFVDLGTAFTLKMDPEEAFEIYVFEGLVKVEVDERFGEVVAQPLRVAEVHAIHFDVKKANFTKLPFNQGEQMPF